MTINTILYALLVSDYAVQNCKTVADNILFCFIIVQIKIRLSISYYPLKYDTKL